jgi:DNA polymerase-3 subunit gamma/tau
VFENVLGQEAVARLAEDMRRDILAPSMLFRGPRASGKGTAALELGRILSCEKPDSNKAWKCSCPACRHHRFLYHPDLLALGSRPFASEIAAAAAAFTAGPSDSAVRAFYIRAVRKLLLRFSPVLWEDEPKAGKIAPILSGLEGDLDEIIARHEGEGGVSPKDAAWAEKISKSIGKNALNLEAEGVSDLIPVAQIRRASYWSRLAPHGRRKLLLIENADRMQDASRNALLKILEEPPENAVIVLATAHSDALLPTILSRLRPYRFYPRSRETEREVLRRVFRADTVREKAAAPIGPGASGAELSIAAYLDSFLPVTGESMFPLAAFFAASAAYRGARFLFGAGLSALPAELEALGQYASGIAEEAGLERHAGDTGSCVAAVLKGAEDFKAPGLFARFLEALLSVVSGGLRCARPSPGMTAFADLWRGAASEAALAAGTYNQTPALVLDRLCTELAGRMAALYRPSGVS